MTTCSLVIVSFLTMFAFKVLDKNGEESLYKLLVSAKGTDQDAVHSAKTSAVVKLVHKQEQLKKVAAGNHQDWMTKAVDGADSKLTMTHTAQSYKEQEEARADALEESLIGS